MDDRHVLLGRIVGVFGVKGWVKIHSYTEPRENIFAYQPWQLSNAQSVRTVDKVIGKVQGQQLIAQLPQVDDRDQAAALLQTEIWVSKDLLPKLKEDEYYWSDLEGLEVETIESRKLGKVSHLLSTAANDVIVVVGDKERLIPFIWEQVVKSISLTERKIVVDWDPDF